MKRYFGKKFTHLESEINNKISKNKENPVSLNSFSEFYFR